MQLTPTKGFQLLNDLPCRTNRNQKSVKRAGNVLIMAPHRKFYQIITRRDREEEKAGERKGTMELSGGGELKSMKGTFWLSVTELYRERELTVRLYRNKKGFRLGNFNLILSPVTQEQQFESEYRPQKIMAGYTEELRALRVSANSKHISKTPAI